MLILGLSGGFDPPHPRDGASDDYRVAKDRYWFHDSAAVLVEDGEVVAAVEEERLNRIKHTNCFPARAIRFCLEQRRVRLDALDRIAYYSREDFIDWVTGVHMLRNPELKPIWSGRSLLAHTLRRHFGVSFDPDRLVFVDHHRCHAESAAAMSPFPRSLVVTLDGQGDGLSGTVSIARGGKLERIAEFPEANSLGNFYTNVIAFLGYTLFDEYKVMGLAPYGNPERVRELFRRMYSLDACGRYTIEQKQVALLASLGQPRRPDQPFTQVHKDIAAGLQEAIEALAFHVIEHHARATGERHLTLAGGVAHNCTLNGKLVRSGMFEGVFVQPAAHDAGCALGAALVVQQTLDPAPAIAPFQHAFWGRDIGTSDRVEAELDRWKNLVKRRRLSTRSRTVAELLAAGAVIGWVQGRSEFGPRALGNRSILADPRPSANKDAINAMVKKRESYRPFAPSVLDSAASDFFELTPGASWSHMGVVTLVAEDKRELLGAVTHVDGTARIQLVRRHENPRFWELIAAFHEITSVPVLLNTSFNNHREPIVDSIDDAVTCFLTTRLDYLVVDDFLVERRGDAGDALLELLPSVPAHVQLARTMQHDGDGGWCLRHHCIDTSREEHVPLAAPIYDLLERADGSRTLGEIVATHASAIDASFVLKELSALWEERLIRFCPVNAAQVGSG